MHYLHMFSNDIISKAEQEGLDIFDVEGEKAVREEVKSFEYNHKLMTAKTSVEIPSRIRKELEKTSEEMELDEEEIIDRAITMYLDMVNKEKDLKKEFSAWDKASDEALASTEESVFSLEGDDFEVHS